MIAGNICKIHTHPPLGVRIEPGLTYCEAVSLPDAPSEGKKKLIPIGVALSLFDLDLSCTLHLLNMKKDIGERYVRVGYPKAVDKQG